MITDLILPKFNMDMESGVLIRWLRSEGDRVSVGDVVAEVSTDKVNMEVEATADGILFDLRYAEGDTVPVTAPIARIASDETEIARMRAGRRAEPHPTVQVAEAPRPSIALQRPSGEPAVPKWEPYEEGRPGPYPDRQPRAPAVQGRGESQIGAIERPRATPAARRLARELGVDLASLAPAGRRITSAQVQQAARPPAANGESLRSARLGGEALPRGAPARQLTLGASGPHEAARSPLVSLWAEVRLGGHLETLGTASRPSRQAVWVFLVARALRDHPLLNCSLGETGLVPNSPVHIALQIPAQAGLRSTVVREADRLTLLEIDEELRDHRPGSVGRSPEPANPGDATFTIVDLGEADVEGFVPALRPPQVAALGLGRPGPRVTAVDGDGLRVETRLQLTLVCDGRAADEAQAASFLATLRRLVMSPDVVEAGLIAAAAVRSGSLARL